MSEHTILYGKKWNYSKEDLFFKCIIAFLNCQNYYDKILMEVYDICFSLN